MSSVLTLQILLKQRAKAKINKFQALKLLTLWFNPTLIQCLPVFRPSKKPLLSRLLTIGADVIKAESGKAKIKKPKTIQDCTICVSKIEKCAGDILYDVVVVLMQGWKMSIMNSINP